MIDDMRDSLEVPADLAQIAHALAWLEQIGERDAWPARLRFGMELSLDEALTNIVSYAYPEALQAGPSIGHITLHVARVDDQVALTIEDDGVAYDPTQLPPPAAVDSIDDAEIGGHGMQLMRHYMDAIRYARVDGRNQLTLVADCGAARGA